MKDFGFQLFLRLQTSRGTVYYRILGGGQIQKMTSHFIKRFIERSPYNCDESNFLGYLARDLNVPLLIYPSGKVSYSPTEKGFMVIQDNCYITYMTDLSRTNQSREKEAQKEIDKMYSRQLSLEYAKEYYLKSICYSK